MPTGHAAFAGMFGQAHEEKARRSRRIPFKSQDAVPCYADRLKL